MPSHTELKGKKRISPRSIPVHLSHWEWQRNRDAALTQGLDIATDFADADSWPDNSRARRTSGEAGGHGATGACAVQLSTGRKRQRSPKWGSGSPPTLEAARVILTHGGWYAENPRQLPPGMGGRIRHCLPRIHTEQKAISGGV